MFLPVSYTHLDVYKRQIPLYSLEFLFVSTFKTYNLPFWYKQKRNGKAHVVGELYGDVVGNVTGQISPNISNGPN